MEKAKVLIVGAGPSGLMMAFVLSRYNIPFKIIDKKEGITPFSKALGMQARTLELFRDLGIVKKILEKGYPISTLEVYQGEERLAEASFARLETEYPFIFCIAQTETEAVLETALREKSVEVEWNCELIDLYPRKERVDVTLSCRGEMLKESYAWVIGCDGVRSVVRENNTISFLGNREPQHFALADVKMEGELDIKGARNVIAKNNQGMVLFLPIMKGCVRIVIDRCELKQQEIPTLEYFSKVLKERVGDHVQIKEILWSSVFNIQYRQATLFSKGRCFLVGDAAHVHSPIGGQGMNTGLQDAYNLGWKLALVIKGRAKESLLSTYHEERWENARRLLEMTHVMTKVISAEGAFIAFLRPFILRLALNTRWINDKLVSRVSQLRIHYRKMSLSKEYCVKGFEKAPSAGERVVDRPIQVIGYPHKNTFFDYLQEGVFNLILFLTSSFQEDPKQLKELELIETSHDSLLRKAVVVYKKEDLTQGAWSGEVLVDREGVLHQRYGALKPCMYLIRPDKYIALRYPAIEYSCIKKYMKSSLKL